MRTILVPLSALVFSAGIAVGAPFKDVPTSHWAYDAIHKLSASGVFQGVTPEKFAGNKGVSRYELAVTTARLLARVEQVMQNEDGTSKLVTKEDLVSIEKLQKEFSDELASLGIRTGKLEEDLVKAKEDVSLLKTDVKEIKDKMATGIDEKIKIGGNLLVRHSNLHHKNDWRINPYSPATPRTGNSNNSLTESQFRFMFNAKVDENIDFSARWVLFGKHTDSQLNLASSNRGGVFGVAGPVPGIGNLSVSDNSINYAYLNIKKMFQDPGMFTFGRVLYNANHGMLIDNYIDVVRYGRKIGDVDMMVQAIYDRHQGSYKDDGPVDYRPVYNLDLKTKVRDHSLYLGLYAQDEPALAQRRNRDILLSSAFPTAAQINGTPKIFGSQLSDERRDVEFGSKGQIGKSSHWSYDLGFTFTNYSIDMLTSVATPTRDIDLAGWQGLAAVKYESHKNWAGKVSYAFADDESMGGITLLNDMRYVDFAETPWEDISRGNPYFSRGMQNMYDLKLQAEYKPKECKHYARLAFDFLDELDGAPVNDLNRYRSGHGLVNSAIPADKTNTLYDRTNNFATAEAKAMVTTIEYRYQLAKNTRIRVGCTIFDFGGDAVKGAARIGAGNGRYNDFDYIYLFSEIGSKF